MRARGTRGVRSGCGRGLVPELDLDLEEVAWGRRVGGAHDTDDPPRPGAGGRRAHAREEVAGEAL